MIHSVASYACGATPVCESCERLVAEGTVVVAAAGNLGQAIFQNTDNSTAQGFRMVNITDPGNAESVITVGATHRDRPHSYGVSYFSSKGPTGDGRVKPDLVAPGEKIISSVLDDGTDRMDGTSMAAPHVSGAAALLMARHQELIGKPARIKNILCKTATDLGRERYFQGCGLVDVLRAIQSI
jgi:subtilisin family serine protease